MHINGLAAGDTIGLIDCSDGIPPQQAGHVPALEAALAELGLRARRARTIFTDPTLGIASGPAERRAAALTVPINIHIKLVGSAAGVGVAIGPAQAFISNLSSNNVSSAQGKGQQ